ncbi:MAG: hypothetical protein KC441_04355 [Anaerolineales bacterium]|mgnify:CR=1 FL=1|nr:hypothetical protein [Anaerolineales bacterium]
MKVIPLMRVFLEVECVVPHDLASLTQGQVVEAIAQAVVDGYLPANLTIQLADEKASLHDVHPAIKNMWLARLAADSIRFTQAEAELPDLEVDDAGQLEEPFLIWPIGTSLVDVQAWFREIKK